MIRKSFSAITKVVDEAQGLVEALVNSTNIVDLQKDNLHPGCWEPICKAMSLGEVKYPAILWGHNWETPVGKVVHAEELYPGDARLKAAKAKPDAGALRIIGQYNLDTQRGREAFSDVKFGSITEWSVGFDVAPEDHTYDTKGIHHIAKVAIWPEVSNVLIGASPGTLTTIAKSAEEVLTSADSVGDKALAIEQVCLQAVEDDNQAEALEIALSALRALSQEPPAPEAEPIQHQAETTADATLSPELAAKLIELVTERLSAPPQHSDLEDSGDDIPLTNWARHNIRPTNSNKE